MYIRKTINPKRSFHSMSSKAIKLFAGTGLAAVIAIGGGAGQSVQSAGEAEDLANQALEENWDHKGVSEDDVFPEE